MTGVQTCALPICFPVTIVCFIDVNVFQKILDENHAFANEIIIDLCQNELESFRRCASRTQKLIRGNMADALLEFADRIFMSDTFVLPLSQSELASLVDTSRESVSRVLAEFDKDGIIKMSGKTILSYMFSALTVMIFIFSTSLGGLEILNLAGV